jgi:hypothetical protein
MRVGGPVVARWWPIRLAGHGVNSPCSPNHGKTRRRWHHGRLRKSASSVACLSIRTGQGFGPSLDYLLRESAMSLEAGRCPYISTGGAIAPKRKPGCTSLAVSRRTSLKFQCGLMNPRMSLAMLGGLVTYANVDADLPHRLGSMGVRIVVATAARQSHSIAQKSASQSANIRRTIWPYGWSNWPDVAK